MIGDKIIFILQLIIAIAIAFAIAYIAEKIADRKIVTNRNTFATRKITMIGIFAAISSILMLLEIPVPFAPPFYKIDLSELPVLIVTFAYGPVSGILAELVKIIIKILFKSSQTAFVGELANFVVGSSFILPAGCIYYSRKSKKRAIIGCISGTLCMAAFGAWFNAIYLLPAFAQMYGMSIDAIIDMGRVINSSINSINSLVLICVIPLNLLKGAIVSIITIFLYKRLSPILKNNKR